MMGPATAQLPSATAHDERKDARLQEPQGVDDARWRHSSRWSKARGPIGILTLVPFGIAAYFSTPLATSRSPLAFVLEGLGWALLLSGTAIRLWATLYIGTSKCKKLICDGPYSLCRNPLYVGTFFITLSIPAFLQSPIFAVGVILSSTLYLWATMPFEEEQLQHHFGQEYLDYCSQVPRFLPRFRHWNSPSTVEISVRALRIESVRALRWMLIPIIAQLVYQFQIGNF